MKKISSEISINDISNLKVKWGTIDKKNPSFIYLELGTYITPTQNQETYSDNIYQIEKSAKQIVKNIVLGSRDVKPNFIFVTDVADTRISYGKKSYISMQVHLGRYSNDEKPNFKEIVNDMDTRWRTAYDNILTTIKDNGFSCSKSKK